MNNRFNDINSNNTTDLTSQHLINAKDESFPGLIGFAGILKSHLTNHTQGIC